MIHIGIKPHQLGATLPELHLAWREAEDAGFESVWVFDHVNRADEQPCPEALALLAALARETSRVRLGVLVLNPGLRHPAWLATSLATLDHVSDGRIEVGVGAGSQFGMADLVSFGLPTPGLRGRIDRLEEYVQVLKLLWTGDKRDFSGRHFRLDGAQIGVRPLQRNLPLIVGGGSRKLLEVAARHASEWNFSTQEPAEFRLRGATLHELCAQYRREVARSAQVYLRAVSDSELEALAERFEEAGAQRLIVIADPPYPKGKVAALGRRLLSSAGG